MEATLYERLLACLTSEAQSIGTIRENHFIDNDEPPTRKELRAALESLLVVPGVEVFDGDDGAHVGWRRVW